MPGITRDSIMTIAKDLGYIVKEQTITPKDLKRFDEAFFTGTAVEVNGIGKINGVVFNKGKEGQVTKQLRQTYTQTVSGALPPLQKVADGGEINKKHREMPDVFMQIALPNAALTLQPITSILSIIPLGMK